MVLITKRVTSLTFQLEVSILHNGESFRLGIASKPLIFTNPPNRSIQYRTLLPMDRSNILPCYHLPIDRSNILPCYQWIDPISYLAAIYQWIDPIYCLTTNGSIQYRTLLPMDRSSILPCYHLPMDRSNILPCYQ